jgi:DNA repair exonuclease SbcCD ATPase subunit
VQRDVLAVTSQLSAITEDQSRLRANFEKMPPTSAAYKRYLEKFDVQESEIEKQQAAIQEKKSAEKALRQEFEEFAAGLNLDG